MTPSPQPRFIAEPNGFLPPDSSPLLAHLPMKTGMRHRAKPTCWLQLDGWLLEPETLRRISAELRQRARAANVRRPADRDRDLDEAADGVDRFLGERRVYGEGPRPWR